MTKKEKIRFVRELVGDIRSMILDKVAAMPDDWDGFELRQYIADKFVSQSVGGMKMSGTRAKQYKNDVIVLNL